MRLLKFIHSIFVVVILSEKKNIWLSDMYNIVHMPLHSAITLIQFSGDGKHNDSH